MSKIFTGILDEARKNVWDKLVGLPKGGILGGGTALALQIGHRKSYDFDIFYNKPISANYLLKLKKLFLDNLKQILVDTEDELTVIIDSGIKITLLYYPFPSLFSAVRTSSIPVFNLRDLAANKAYTVGRRGVWRDYVDLYFLLKTHLNLKTVIRDSKAKFRELFNEKLFLQQLGYFEDLEDFLVEFAGAPVSREEIKQFLKGKVKKYIQKLAF